MDERPDVPSYGMTREELAGYGFTDAELESAAREAGFDPPVLAGRADDDVIRALRASTFRELHARTMALGTAVELPATEPMASFAMVRGRRTEGS